MTSKLKDFAKVVDLDERQVLFLKTERDEDERDEDKECDEHPYLLEARFHLLDGTTLSEVKLSFGTEESRDNAFGKVNEEVARGMVDQVKWMEDILLNPDDEEDEDDDYFDDEDDES